VILLLTREELYQAVSGSLANHLFSAQEKVRPLKIHCQEWWYTLVISALEKEAEAGSS
jgi:hypothetical protein